MLACKCIKALIVLPLFLLLSVSDVFSQDYSFIRYDTRDGLAGSVVYDAVQDKEGFMWFATENGLSRFDGKNFKNFTTKDGLPDNEILKLFVDSKGRLWIMPCKPSVCYYHQGKIYNKTNDSLLSKVNLLSYAHDMAEDSSGNIFIAEMHAWHEIFRNQTIKTVSKANDYPIDVNAIGTDRNGEVELLVGEHKVVENQVQEILDYFINRGGERFRLKDRIIWSYFQTSLISPDYVIISGNRGSQLSFYKNKNKVFSAEIPTNSVSISYVHERKDR